MYIQSSPRGHTCMSTACRSFTPFSFPFPPPPSSVVLSNSRVPRRLCVGRHQRGEGEGFPSGRFPGCSFVSSVVSWQRETEVLKTVALSSTTGSKLRSGVPERVRPTREFGRTSTGGRGCEARCQSPSGRATLGGGGGRHPFKGVVDVWVVGVGSRLSLPFW